MNKVDNVGLFSPSAYGDVRRPVTQASTLPPQAYTSPEWYGRELEEIFHRQWMMAAREEDIPSPGDYLRVDMVGEPLILLRDTAGQIQAFSASCRHRGTELISGRGNCKRLICPYHGWVYSLTGELVSARGMEETEGFDRTKMGLIPVRVERWGGFIFVNFDPNAASLPVSMAGLQERFAAYRPEQMRVTRRWVRRLNINWKVWVENSRENYHTPIAHRESLRRLGRPASSTIYHVTGVSGVYQINSGWIGGALQVPNEHFPFLEGPSEEDSQLQHLIVFYPHFLLNLLPDHMAYHQLFPDGPEHTTVVSTKCFPVSVIERPTFEQEAIAYYEPADLFFEEDWNLCEQFQRGIRGRLTPPGRYSVQETLLHDFVNYILDRVVGRSHAPTKDAG